MQFIIHTQKRQDPITRCLACNERLKNKYNVLCFSCNINYANTLTRKYKEQIRTLFHIQRIEKQEWVITINLEHMYGQKLGRKGHPIARITKNMKSGKTLTIYGKDLTVKETHTIYNQAQAIRYLYAYVRLHTPYTHYEWLDDAIKTYGVCTAMQLHDAQKEYERHHYLNECNMCGGNNTGTLHHNDNNPVIAHNGEWVKINNKYVCNACQTPRDNRASSL